MEGLQHFAATKNYLDNHDFSAGKPGEVMKFSFLKRSGNPEHIINLQKIKKLTGQIACMETQLKQNSNIQHQTQSDLISARDLCVKLDEQKDNLLREYREKECALTRLEQDNADLRTRLCCLECQTSKDQDSMDNLEKLLCVARQENMEQKLHNSENEEEICRLRRLIDEIKAKHKATQQQLDVFQEKALEYSQQLKQLRREIANERFNRTHSGDTSNRYPSL